MDKITKYEYCDDVGDKVLLTHVVRICKCNCNCYSDTLFYKPEGDFESYTLEMESSEQKWVIEDLIRMSIASGQLKEVK